MALTKQQENKLWIAFLSVYDPDLWYIEQKKAYARKVAELNLSWCTPCQTNSTFKQFKFDAEELSSKEIQTILNSNSTNMPVKKTKKKTDTKKATKAVVKKKKTTTKKAEVKTTTKKAEPKKVVKAKVEKKAEAVKNPGGIKFLYIPKRK